MAPGIGDGWPEIIPAPHTPNARLKRMEGDPTSELTALRARVAELEGVVELLMSATLNTPEIYREFGEIAASYGREDGLYKIIAGQIEHARSAAEAARAGQEGESMTTPTQETLALRAEMGITPKETPQPLEKQGDE